MSKLLRYEKLFWIKHRLGMNQREVAMKADRHYSLISKWQCYLTNSPRVEEVVEELYKQAMEKAA